MKQENIKKIIPNYMKHFSCIGGKCEDTCCAGWMIPIDEKAYMKYKKVKDKSFKLRLDKELVHKRSSNDPQYVAKIKLKNNRCAFLSKEGWCDIYTVLGEKYLSSTCALYPRTINKVGEALECSLVCSCPEAARKILLKEDPILFESINEEIKDYTISAELKVHTENPKVWQDYFFVLREVIISVLQNRQQCIETRLVGLEHCTKRLNNYLIGSHIKEIPKVLKLHKEEKLNKREEQDLEKLIKLALEMKNFKEQTKIKSKRYEDCLDKALLGLGLTGDLTKNQLEERYLTGYNVYYKPFLQQKGYILENYLVNYVFERCIPLDEKTPYDSFKHMKLYYDLIKLHLIGIALSEEALRDEDVIKVIQSFSKTFDHDDKSIQNFLKII